MAGRRDISPILQRFRDFLLHRKNVNFLRFRDEIAARTQPPPNLPDGPHKKLAGNYYYTRDARRLVKPEETLYESGSVPKLQSGVEQPSVIQRIPGSVHHWDK